MIRKLTEWMFPEKKVARLASEDDYKIALAKVEAARRVRPPATLTAKNAVLRERQMNQASIGSPTTAPVDSSSNDMTNALLLNSLMSSPSASEPSREVSSHGGTFDGAGASADWSSCSSSSDSSSSYSSDSVSSDSSSSCSSGD